MTEKNDSIELLPVSTEDAETLADISKRAFESDIKVGSSVKGGPRGYDSVAEHRRHAESDWLDYLKILYKGTIVGGMRVYRMTKGHDEIMGVYIDPEYHRRGFGKRAFELVLEMYPDAKQWTLDTPVWNIRTKNFYEKLGFEQYGVLRWEHDFELRAYKLVLDPDFRIELTPIGNLIDSMERVVVEGIIDGVPEPREVTSKKDGTTHHVADIILSDDTGSVKLVLWNDMIRQVNKGERVLIEPGYTTSFQNELQLNVSRYGRIIILS